MIEEIYFRSEAGHYLLLNEDLCSYELEHQLFFLLDGFGGRGRGDEITKNISEELRKRFNQFSQDPDLTFHLFWNPQFSIEANFLINSLLSMHKKYFLENQNKKPSQRSGCSGAFGILSEGKLHLVTIGAVRVCLYRNHQIIPIHLEDAYQVDTVNPGERYPVPISALGMGEELNYFFREFQLQASDIVLFMGPGTWDRLPVVQAENGPMPEQSSMLKELVTKIFQEKEGHSFLNSSLLGVSYLGQGKE